MQSSSATSVQVNALTRANKTSKLTMLLTCLWYYPPLKYSYEIPVCTGAGMIKRRVLIKRFRQHKL